MGLVYECVSEVDFVCVCVCVIPVNIPVYVLVCWELVLGECGLHSNHRSWWSAINSLSGVDDLDKKKRSCCEIYQV